MKKRKVGQFIVFGLLSLVFVMFLGRQVYAQNSVPNINGQWTYHSVGVFVSDGDTCSIFNDRPVPDSTVTIIQRNTSFSSSGGISYYPGRSAENMAIGEGTITGNQIQSRHQTMYQSRPVYIVSWSGNISSDANTISGNITCTKTDGRPGEGSLRFTLTRVSRPSSSQTNGQPATPPSSPSQTNRPSVTPPPSSTQTPSNSPAPPFPQEAGPNIIRPDFR